MDRSSLWAPDSFGNNRSSCQIVQNAAQHKLITMQLSAPQCQLSATQNIQHTHIAHRWLDSITCRNYVCYVPLFSTMKPWVFQTLPTPPAQNTDDHNKYYRWNTSRQKHTKSSLKRNKRPTWFGKGCTKQPPHSEVKLSHVIDRLTDRHRRQ